MKYTYLLIGLLLAILIVGVPACGDDDDDTNDPAATDDDAVDDDATDDDTSVGDDDSADDDEVDCDASRTPIVFAHGFLENGDAFSTQAMRFGSNGYCLNRIYTYDWNTLMEGGEETDRLDAFIDEVLAETGATQVDLLGHSMGGWLGGDYILDATHAAKIAHYVNLAAGGQDSAPNGVPVLNISSPDDTMVGQVDWTGAQNEVFPGLDHLQVATSEQTFAAAYRFFNDEEPTTTQPVPDEIVELSGRTVVIGANEPVANMFINIFAVDPLTGARLSNEPAGIVHSDENGYWHGFTALPDTYYEFVCLDPAGFWPEIHYYREPFPRSNNKVYFRVFPAPDTMLGFLMRIIPLNDAYALFAWLNVNQAVIVGRDTMSIDGIDLATDEIADPGNTTLVVGFFDANFNGVGDDRPAGGLYTWVPFIRVFDMLVDTDVSRPIIFEFNGRTMAIPNWKSETEGLSIAVFN